MPDELKRNANNESAASFIEHEVERAKNNLHCAMNKLGHAALLAVNPIPWLRRYPVKCGLVTGAVVAGGALAVVIAVRKNKTSGSQSESNRPINVYVKKPRPKSKGLGAQLAGALVASLAAKFSESARSVVANAISPERVTGAKPQTYIVPNPNLRDVQI